MQVVFTAGGKRSNPARRSGTRYRLVALGDKLERNKFASSPLSKRSSGTFFRLSSTSLPQWPTRGRGGKAMPRPESSSWQHCPSRVQQLGQTQHKQPIRLVHKPALTTAGPVTTVDQAIDRVIAREHARMHATIRRVQPRSSKPTSRTSTPTQDRADSSSPTITTSARPTSPRASWIIPCYPPKKGKLDRVGILRPHGRPRHRAARGRAPGRAEAVTSGSNAQETGGSRPTAGVARPRRR